LRKQEKLPPTIQGRSVVQRSVAVIRALCWTITGKKVIHLYIIGVLISFDIPMASQNCINLPEI